MSRPTRYCAKCGEYVAERHIYMPYQRRVERRLVHISADGAVIYRNHAPVEE